MKTYTQTYTGIHADIDTHKQTYTEYTQINVQMDTQTYRRTVSSACLFLC